MTRYIRYVFRCLAVVLALSVALPEAFAAPEPASSSSSAAKRKSSGKKKKKRKTKKKKSSVFRKKRKSSRKTSRRGHVSRRRVVRRPAVQTLWMSPDSTSWIHKGAKGIIIYRDSLGVTRAMQPCTTSPSAGHGYAAVISDYARALQPDSVQVYMLMAPSQGEYYLPEGYATPGAEQRCIEATAASLDPLVRPVMINDTMRSHLAEEIYNRTDHHWAPLGAYYAAGALARAAGVKFLPLSAYNSRTINDYVGTMYKFSGDPQVKNSPETFVYFMPPGNFEAEFITYSLRGGKTCAESAPHQEEFFKNYPDGSGAAYLTFMGGDTRTVKVSKTGGTPGRRLLIVKDSFGNALAPALFGSFEEVHVVDFRFFPHNLASYARNNGITDMVFVNCVPLALNPNTAARLRSMLTHNDGNVFDEPAEIPQPEEGNETEGAVRKDNPDGEEVDAGDTDEEESGDDSDDDSEEDDDEEESEDDDTEE